MSTYLAFLRAVNVGGTGKLSMADLKAWLAQLGLTDVRTLLQSGNVVFRAERTTPEKLEPRLEAAAAKDLGLTTTFFIRTADEWTDALAHNPFAAAAKNDPSHLALAVLKSAPTAAQVQSLQAAVKGREQVRAHGRHAYIVYPDGMGPSKLTLAVIEKHLATRATARNWNTAQKMAALAGAD